MCCSAYHWQSFLIFSIWNIYFRFSSFLLLLSHPPLFVLSFFYPVFNQGIKTGISVMGKKFITGFTHNIIVEADGDVHGRFSSVQSLSHVRLFATPWIAARQASLSINNSWPLDHQASPLLAILITEASLNHHWRGRVLLPSVRKPAQSVG